MHFLNYFQIKIIILNLTRILKLLLKPYINIMLLQICIIICTFKYGSSGKSPNSQLQLIPLVGESPAHLQSNRSLQGGWQTSPIPSLMLRDKCRSLFLFLCLSLSLPWQWPVQKETLEQWLLGVCSQSSREDSGGFGGLRLPAIKGLQQDPHWD